MEQVRTNADGARVRLLERADEAARENHAARRYAEKTTRSFRSTTRPLDRSAPKYAETAEDRRARRERRRKSMAYSDGVPRRLLDARCFPTRGGDAAQDVDDDDDGIAVSSVSVASARAARARRALATRLGTDLPELDPAGRRRAREGARRVARREEEEAAEAMRASGVIDAARARRTRSSRRGLTWTKTTRPKDRGDESTVPARGHGRRRLGHGLGIGEEDDEGSFRDSTGAGGRPGFAHRGGGVGDARRARLGANDDAKNDEAGNRTGDGDATRRLARTARADPRRDASRAHHRAVPVGTARGRGRFARVFTEGNDGEIAREFVEVRAASVASTAAPRGDRARRRARRRSRRQRRGECSASRRRNPRRDFEPFSWVHPRGRRRGTSRRMSFAARRRSRLGSTLAGSRGRRDSTAIPIDPPRVGSRRSRDRRWCPRRSAARRFAGFARRRFEWSGRGWNAGETRRGGRRRRRGRWICSTTRRRRGRRDREARGRCSWNSAYRTSRSPPCPCPRGRRTSSGDGGKASDTVRRSSRRANFCSSCQNRRQSCVDVTVGFSNRTRATTSVFVTSPRRVGPAVSWTGTWPR